MVGWPGRENATPRVSRVEMVLTLRTGKSEGHQAYRSQSGSTPGKGTTMGGQTDDPGRQDTRTAVARHATSGAAWRQPRVPGPGDLPHPVLPVAPAPGALRDRRLAPAPVAGAARPAAPARAAARTAHPQRRGQRGDVGLRPPRRALGPSLGGARCAQYDSAPAAPAGLGYAPPPAVG